MYFSKKWQIQIVYCKATQELKRSLVQSGRISSATFFGRQCTDFFFPKKIVKWKQVKITNMILQRQIEQNGDYKNDALVFYSSMWIHLKNFYILERNLRWPDSALMLKKSGIWGRAHDMFSRISQIRIYWIHIWYFVTKLFWHTVRKDCSI